MERSGGSKDEYSVAAHVTDIALRVRDALINLAIHSDGFRIILRPVTFTLQPGHRHVHSEGSFFLDGSLHTETEEDEPIDVEREGDQ